MSRKSFDIPLKFVFPTAVDERKHLGETLGAVHMRFVHEILSREIHDQGKYKKILQEIKYNCESEEESIGRGL